MSTFSVKKCSILLQSMTLTSKRLVETDVKPDIITTKRHPDVMHRSRPAPPGVRQLFFLHRSVTRKFLSGMQEIFSVASAHPSDFCYQYRKGYLWYAQPPSWCPLKSETASVILAHWISDHSFRRPVLLKRHKVEWLIEWANRHIMFTMADWANVLFVDECLGLMVEPVHGVRLKRNDLVDALASFCRHINAH